MITARDLKQIFNRLPFVAKSNPFFEQELENILAEPNISLKQATDRHLEFRGFTPFPEHENPEMDRYTHEVAHLVKGMIDREMELYGLISSGHREDFQTGSHTEAFMFEVEKAIYPNLLSKYDLPSLDDPKVRKSVADEENYVLTLSWLIGDELGSGLIKLAPKSY